MALIIGALILSFIPSVLMFLFLRNNRKEDEAYRKDCLALLGKGFLITWLVFLFDLAVNAVWSLSGIGKSNIWVDAAFKCLIVNATVEELCKFFVANRFIKKDPAKTSRLDIISFITIAAIGFGLVEDLVYALNTNLGQIIIRGLLMGHVPYALFMGLLYSKSIVEKKPFLKVLAFVVPILLHGSYNFFLGDNLPEWSAFVVVTEVILETVFMIYMIFFMKKKRNDPTFTSPVFTEETAIKEI